MSGLRAAAIGMFITAASWCAATPTYAMGAPATVQVSIAVCDADHMVPSLLDTAERVAYDAYLEIGVAIEWMNACGIDESGLSVNVISRQATSVEVSDVTLGFAEPGASAATVLYDRVDAFAHRYHIKREILLGYVMAHELGHLLLPPHSHSPAGVMRATIDLELASAQKLRFTHDQGALIVRKIEGSPIAVATH